MAVCHVGTERGESCESARLDLTPSLLSWKPLLGTALLEVSMGRGLGALEGLSRRLVIGRALAVAIIVVSRKVPQPSNTRVSNAGCVFLLGGLTPLAAKGRVGGWGG